MLHHPHTRYVRLYVYYLDRLQLPPIDHPDFIGLWVEDEHAILFFHTPQESLVAELCQQAGAQIIYQADLDYRDWEAGVTIGSFNTKALTIRPVWEQLSAAETNKQEIVLDPSVIFGSGFHPTTRMCLETLERVMLESGMKIRSVADLGTGTGLLAIAAAKLGAEKVTALDSNPLACTVARTNVVKNNCEAQVDVLQHDLLAGLPDIGGYDLVIANLYKGLLIQLFTDPSFWKAGMYLVSGIIPAMEGDLLEALPHKEISFLHRGNSEIWRLWLLSTKAQQGIEQ
jgi:ribosomal protein L11 methyltransferase